MASVARSFRIICSGVCRLRRREIKSPPSPLQGLLDSHNTWTSFRGAGQNLAFLARIAQPLGQPLGQSPAVIGLPENQQPGIGGEMLIGGHYLDSPIESGFK